jgi:methylated-DNA-[protein]-cysteine S-methyltransferase
VMRKSGAFTYRLVPSFLGDVGVVHGHTLTSVLVRAILLPRQGRSMVDIVGGVFPGAVPESGSPGDFYDRLCASLAGTAVDFEIGALDFAGIDGFARRVLMADYAIPRGNVMSYGGLAARVGVPGGARAVGNVMARNPFPLVIPCHRVIRNDGSLGGFGGGLPMKRALLEREGVCVDRSGRVLPEYIVPPDR